MFCIIFDFNVEKGKVVFFFSVKSDDTIIST